MLRAQNPHRLYLPPTFKALLNTAHHRAGSREFDRHLPERRAVAAARGHEEQQEADEEAGEEPAKRTTSTEAPDPERTAHRLCTPAVNTGLASDK